MAFFEQTEFDIRLVEMLKAASKPERPSDIQGLIYIPFKDDIAKKPASR